jgi:hypothetical protein
MCLSSVVASGSAVAYCCLGRLQTGLPERPDAAWLPLSIDVPVFCCVCLARLGILSPHLYVL